MSSAFLTSYVLLWTLVAGTTLLVFRLLREIGNIYLRETTDPGQVGVSVGEPLPDIALSSAKGAGHLSDFVHASARTVLVVIKPDCPACPTAAAALNSFLGRNTDLRGALLVSGGAGDDLAAQHENAPLLVARARVVEEELNVRLTPFAFVLDEHRVVLGKAAVNYEAQLRELVAKASAYGDGHDNSVDSMLRALDAHDSSANGNDTTPVGLTESA